MHAMPYAANLPTWSPIRTYIPILDQYRAHTGPSDAHLNASNVRTYLEICIFTCAVHRSFNITCHLLELLYAIHTGLGL